MWFCMGSRARGRRATHVGPSDVSRPRPRVGGIAATSAGRALRTVRDLCRAFKAGKLPNSLDDDQYVNVRTVKKLALK